MAALDLDVLAELVAIALVAELVAIEAVVVLVAIEVVVVLVAIEVVVAELEPQHARHRRVQLAPAPWWWSPSLPR